MRFKWFFVFCLIFVPSVAGCGGAGNPTTESSFSSSTIVASTDQYTTFRNVALYVSSEEGVLVNDTPPQGSVSFSTRSQEGGSVRGYGQGSFFYTPPVDFTGTDSFTYLFTSQNSEASGLVNIEVQPGNSGLSIDLYGGSRQFQLVSPGETQEFASYLQAQIAGGALQGSTSVQQVDAIPFTRFALVEEANLFHAAVARNYAVQLAAESLGYDPLTEAGLQQALAGYQQMNPEARLFLQVAAVFKGNLLEGPSNYDNPGLKELLVSKGLTQFINDPQVGDRDIQTLGAIGAAMNAGQLTIADILNSGTFADIERYDAIVEFVYAGGFRKLVEEYESAPI